MKLRLSSSGRIEVVELVSNSTVVDLQEYVRNVLGVEPERQLLKRLEPNGPRRLLITGSTRRLVDIGLHDEDVVFVEEVSTPGGDPSPANCQNGRSKTNNATPVSDSDSEGNNNTCNTTTGNTTTSNRQKKQNCKKLNDGVRGPGGRCSLSGRSGREESSLSLWEAIKTLGVAAACKTPQPADPAIVGNVFRHEVNSDNSCLFACLNILVCNDQWSTADMRNIVAEHIKIDPDFSDVLLERSREDYVDWIRCSSSWGGYIELIILSRVLNVNIACYDIQTMRLDQYGEDCDRRVYLLYDGIHYDCVMGERITASSPKTSCQPLTVFFPWDEQTQANVQILVSSLHQKRRFAKLSNMQLECQTCHQVFPSKREAEHHATSTNHAHFAQL
eukprot:CAMPEP_0113849072 /NCGR_PEP_ID=MMETSP0372-20130328/2880_1 /TAXON_ID=340204 /ORGANISM="Lankesteria abbotti" /LENGTH=387 /DNA_ID=CAMNT_0000818727 /DNA_START=145 /DNA_END=1308 /DNA_ORIENTATION=+ /assembly_acc=CAM_ASM_000359